MKCYFRLPKTQPRDHAPYKTILLRHAAQYIQDLAINKAKVADICWNRDGGHSPEQLVEQIRAGALEYTLTRARQAAGVDNLEPFLPFCDHLADDLRRILQIGVHDDDRFSGSHVHSSCDRDLMAEIARQTDIAVTRIIANKGLQNNGAAICAAVINKYRFGRSVELLHQHPDAPQQNRKHRRLV